MKRWWLLALALWIGLVVSGGGHWQGWVVQAADRLEEGLQVGQRPPRFSAQDLSGKRHTLEQYKGDVLVLHFWASWCPFCRGEVPKLKMLHTEEWAAQGVAVLTVSVDEDLERLQQFVTQGELPYAVIPDYAAEPLILRQYAVSGIPATYIIGRDGRTLFRFEGRADIVGGVKQALEQSTVPSTSL